MEDFRAAICAILEADNPPSVRGIYYKLITMKKIGKEESQYDAVDRVTVQLREQGVIAFEWIGDGTRWVMVPATYSNLRDDLEDYVDTRQRDIWADQPCHLEIWC
jgi:hypothetical protein